MTHAVTFLSDVSLKLLRFGTRLYAESAKSELTQSPRVTTLNWTGIMWLFCYLLVNLPMASSINIFPEIPPSDLCIQRVKSNSPKWYGGTMIIPNNPKVNSNNSWCEDSEWGDSSYHWIGSCLVSDRQVFRKQCICWFSLYDIIWPQIQNESWLWITIESLRDYWLSLEPYLYDGPNPSRNPSLLRPLPWVGIGQALCAYIQSSIWSSESIILLW
jgi:hypothetical protein